MVSVSAKTNVILILVGLLLAGGILLNEEAFSYGRTRGKTKDETLRVREEMVLISRQLGVTCTHCHDTNNFRSSAMPTHKIAKEHMRITSWLNKSGFKGRPKADCYLCHRGKAIPDYIEKLDSL